MTEGFAGIGGSGPTEAVRTGVALVDSILASVDAAGDLPPAAQVGVFERAHEQLRRALDAPVDGAPTLNEDN